MIYVKPEIKEAPERVHMAEPTKPCRCSGNSSH